MSRCLICFKVIENTFFNIIYNNKICYECSNKFKKRNDSFVFENVKINILYYYDEFFKEQLYKYKGCFDYELKDAFLNYCKNDIKRKYKGYHIILAPSNKEAEEKRGFNHLEGIFECVGLPILKCFYKNKDWKQSDKKLSERKKIQNIIKLDKSKLFDVKKVLIVDDVLTTGSTIKTMIRQIPPNIDKEVLVLSSNCKIVSNEFV